MRVIIISFLLTLVFAIGAWSLRGRHRALSQALAALAVVTGFLLGGAFFGLYGG